MLVRVFRRLKIVRCKSALRDRESLVLGQVPVILCGTGSEGYSDDDRGDAQHSSNETKLIDRRRERAWLQVKLF